MTSAQVSVVRAVGGQSCRWSQMSVVTNVGGHKCRCPKCHLAQMSAGTNMVGPNSYVTYVSGTFITLSQSQVNISDMSEEVPVFIYY